ncbi:MAG: FkbM family methyltransferase [Elusimicrobia bacterium]|nr:FkbM family methyltransferase [Elusimicrobiota bacterium]
MRLPSGLTNICRSYAFQLGMSGALSNRLAYATLYWWHYLIARRGSAQADSTQAHAAAMGYLSRQGWSRRVVRVRMRGEPGLCLEIDLMTVFMILREIWVEGIYHTCALGDFSLHEGDVVVDVGGQQGCYAALAAKEVGASGRVYSFEPMPANYELLTRNVARNELRNVTAVPLALSDKAGSALLFLDGLNSGGHSLNACEPGGKSLAVAVETLDGLAAKLSLKPSFLKIDVEGYGAHVLRGGQALLRCHKPRVVMEVHSPQEEEEAGALLRGLGYAVQRSGNNLFAIVR